MRRPDAQPRRTWRRTTLAARGVRVAVAVAAATLALGLNSSPLRGQAARNVAGIERAPGLDVTSITTDGDSAGPVHTIPTARALSRDNAGSASRKRKATPWSILASAGLAGSGQAILGQDRFLAYFVVEAYAWSRYVADSRQGERERSAYRRLAAQVARAPFTTNPKNGDWDYYERMEHYVESGAFDRGSAGDFEPETDTTTSNGALWQLARETYWKDPKSAPDRSSQEWKRAEQFYRSRAITPDRRWSWRNALLEYDEFRRTIRRSNEGLRRSLTDIGVVIANHALSTVDAFVTVRLRDREMSRDGRYRLELSFPLEIRR